MKKELVVEYLSVTQVAVRLGISPSTVRRKFAALPGVVDLGSQERLHRRGRRILRIPRSVLDQYLAEHLVNRPHYQRGVRLTVKRK